MLVICLRCVDLMIMLLRFCGGLAAEAQSGTLADEYITSWMKVDYDVCNAEDNVTDARSGKVLDLESPMEIVLMLDVSPDRSRQKLDAASANSNRSPQLHLLLPRPSCVSH